MVLGSAFAAMSVSRLEPVSSKTLLYPPGVISVPTAQRLERAQKEIGMEAISSATDAARIWRGRVQVPCPETPRQLVALT